MTTEQREQDCKHAEMIRLSLVPTKQFAVIRGQLERKARRGLLMEVSNLLRTGYSTFPASDAEILEHARHFIAEQLGRAMSQAEVDERRPLPEPTERGQRMYWAQVERVEDWELGQTTAVVRQGPTGETVMGKGVVGSIDRAQGLVLVELLAPGEPPP